jgi:hypothetical protein
LARERKQIQRFFSSVLRLVKTDARASIRFAPGV